MGAMKFKTRGMVSPKGKARVYICCHPDDYYLIDDIADEILKEQNCAVWYYDCKSYVSETELFADLSEMQLFVIPVTSNLLMSKSRVLEAEFPYAKANHIPVLPLMQESGLVEVFNEKFGDIQFLDKFNADETAISYKDKLSKYLSSVLIGDELAEKIREAFDAYVFLSYRKKDRKHAKELMKLIHKNEFCRDIAIWYDEFLTPGENFNDSIRLALEKSELFVLAVTPNLVNEENYIMTTEYPMALNAGKPILPAELIATDRDALREKYREIPDCTNAYDDMAMSEALLSAVKRMAIKEKASSPEHDFFIGLAYLDGIDVEVDHEKALRLIVSAAEAGVPEACEQLVQMYTNGKGVDRSYREAARWRGEKAELYRAKYWEDPCIENGHGYVWELIYYGDCLAEMEMEDDALQTFHKAYYFAEDLLNKFGAPLCESDMSACASRLGRLYKSIGDLEKAEEYIEIDLKFSKSYAEIFGDSRLKLLIAVSYRDLADICLALKRLDDARRYAREALDIYEGLNMMTGTADDKTEFAFALTKYADICFAAGEYRDAYRYQHKALDLYLEVSAVDDSVYCRGNIAGIYDDLSDICKAEGDLAAAREYLERSLEICTALYGKYETLHIETHIALNYAKQGRLCQSEGDTEKARINFEKSFEIYSRLAAETESKHLLRELATTCEDICQIYIDERMLSDARKYCKKAMDIREYLLGAADNPSNRIGLCVSFGKLGDIEYHDGNFHEAKRCYERACEIITGFDSDAEESYEFKKTLAVAYMRIANVYYEEEDYESARDYYIDTVNITEEYASKTESLEDRRAVAMAYVKLGINYHMMRDEKRAADLFLGAIDILEDITEHTDGVDAQMWLSNAYERMGNIYIGRADAESAEVYIRKCYNIRKKLYGIYPGPESTHDLALSCDKLGLIYLKLEKLSESKRYYLECIRLRESYLERVDDLKGMYDLSGNYHWVATIYQSENDHQTAQEYCEKEVAACEEILERESTYANLDSLADTYYEAAYFYFDERRLEYLKKACDAFERLYRNCTRRDFDVPHPDRYPECISIVREAIKKTEKALKPKGLFGWFR